MPGVPGVCDWSRFTVRGVIRLSVDHGLAAGTQQMNNLKNKQLILELNNGGRNLVSSIIAFNRRNTHKSEHAEGIAEWDQVHHEGRVPEG